MPRIGVALVLKRTSGIAAIGCIAGFKLIAELVVLLLVIWPVTVIYVMVAGPDELKQVIHWT